MNSLKKVFSCAFVLLFIFSFALLSNNFQKYHIKSINKTEAIRFLTNNLDNDTETPVFFDEDSLTQFEKNDEFDFVLEDKDNLYIVNNNKLSIINLPSSTLKKQITFDNFSPFDLYISDTQIIVLGTKEEIYNLIPGHKFNYNQSTFCITFVDKNSFKTTKTISFDEAFYNTSQITQNKMYLMLNCYSFFNIETKEFVYPSLLDSSNGKIKLDENNLFLDTLSSNTSLLLYIEIDLSTNNINNFKGFLGLDGLVKIEKDHLVIATAHYETKEQTYLEIFRLANFRYLGYLALDGFVMSLYSIDIYNNYLRIALTNATKEINTIYNIDKVSNELLEKNVLLKNPLLIPQQVNAPKEVNFPVIIFDKNQEFRIMANFFTMTINVIKSEKYNIMDIMNRIYDVLEENNIKAYRIGFVYKSEIENAKIEDFKNQEHFLKVNQYMFEAMGILSKENYKSAFIERKLERTMHCKLLEKEESVDRIQNILIDGYNMSENVIKQWSDSKYIEFGITNEERFIGILLDYNIISILYIDPYHLTFPNHNFDIPLKMSYTTPSFLTRNSTTATSIKNGINDNYYNNTFNIIEMTKMFIEDYNNGKVSDEYMYMFLKEIYGGKKDD